MTGCSQRGFHPSRQQGLVDCYERVNIAAHGQQKPALPRGEIGQYIHFVGKDVAGIRIQHGKPVLKRAPEPQIGQYRRLQAARQDGNPLTLAGRIEPRGVFHQAFGNAAQSFAIFMKINAATAERIMGIETRHCMPFLVNGALNRMQAQRVKLCAKA